MCSRGGRHCTSKRGHKIVRSTKPSIGTEFESKNYREADEGRAIEVRLGRVRQGKGVAVERRAQRHGTDAVDDL